MSDQRFERAVSEWLETGSDRTPATAIDAVLLAVKTTPQERDLRIPRRFTLMPTYMRLAAGIAVVAVLGGAGLIFLNNSPGPGATTPPPSPTSIPTASPAPTDGGLSTADWISYTSERYGFDIKRHPAFVETPSTHTWQMSEAGEIPPAAGEHFYYAGASDGLGVGVSVWSVGVETGMSLDEWLPTYCGAATDLCPADMSLARARPVTTADGHAGFSFAGPAEDSRAFVLVNDRVYIVSAWRSDTDPSVSPFGGGRRLVEAYVSTMRLRPEGPAPAASAPALTESFTSERYGYSLEFPGGFWTANTAAALWDPSSPADSKTDRFVPATEVNGFRAYSTVPPDGVDLDAWIAQFMTHSGEVACSPTRATLGEIVIDGQTGKVRISCDEVEASVVVGDRVYLFTLYLDTGEPYSTAGGRALFYSMIDSVRLSPGTAEVSASPAAS